MREPSAGPHQVQLRLRRELQAETERCDNEARLGPALSGSDLLVGRISSFGQAGLEVDHKCCAGGDVLLVWLVLWCWTSAQFSVAWLGPSVWTSRFLLTSELWESLNIKKAVCDLTTGGPSHATGTNPGQGGHHGLHVAHVEAGRHSWNPPTARVRGASPRLLTVACRGAAIFPELPPSCWGGEEWRRSSSWSVCSGLDSSCDSCHLEH